VVSVDNISAQQLRSALSKVLNDPSYRNAASAVQQKLRSIPGPERAADIIEKKLGSDAVRRVMSS
jgi:UDP:flavonoid glycosyltransferase YjiC (YdhE family)